MLLYPVWCSRKCHHFTSVMHFFFFSPAEFQTATAFSEEQGRVITDAPPCLAAGLLFLLHTAGMYPMLKIPCSPRSDYLYCLLHRLCLHCISAKKKQMTWIIAHPPHSPCNNVMISFTLKDQKDLPSCCQSHRAHALFYFFFSPP